MEPDLQLVGHIRNMIVAAWSRDAEIIGVLDRLTKALKPFEGKRVTRRLLEPAKAAFADQPERQVYYSDAYDHYEIHVQPRLPMNSRHGDISLRLAARKDPYYRLEYDPTEQYRTANARRDCQLAGDEPERIALAIHTLFAAHLAYQDLTKDSPEHYALDEQITEPYAGVDLKSLYKRVPGAVRIAK